jgi:hypothetical protein
MSETEKQNQTSSRKVRSGRAVADQLTRLVKKYYLEGHHKIWIRPSGRRLSRSVDGAKSWNGPRLTCCFEGVL